MGSEPKGRWSRFWCFIRNRHDFVEFADGLKRRCTSCGREEWVFSNPYPAIGEPKYYWKDMTL